MEISPGSSDEGATTRGLPPPTELAPEGRRKLFLAHPVQNYRARLSATRTQRCLFVNSDICTKGDVGINQDLPFPIGGINEVNCG